MVLFLGLRLDRMERKLGDIFISILTKIGIWVAIPSIIGQILNYYFGYDPVIVTIISALVMWGVYTELRIQDLKKDSGRKEND